MKNSTLLEKIKSLLSSEVKLAEMMMADGVTKISADAFETGKEVFVVTEDEQMIPVPVGEYELEDGMILVIVEEGIISEIKEMPTTEEAAPEEEKAPEVEVEAETEKVAPKKTIESIVKESFFSEIANLKKENAELKEMLAKVTKVDEVANESTELTETPTPISFNPERESKESFKIGNNKPKSIMDSILNKMYN